MKELCTRSVALSVMISLLTSLSTMLVLKWLNPSQRILMIDLNALVKEQAGMLASISLSDRDIEQKITEKIKSLKNLLTTLGAQHHAIIIKSESVLGGGQDITPFIREQLEAGQ